MEGGAFEADSPTGWEQLCCPFDHGIIIPASSVATRAKEHILFYEGRYASHERRYKADMPMAIVSGSDSNPLRSDLG